MRGAGHMLRYLYDRRGLLSSNMIEAGGFVDVTGAGRSDIQFHMMPVFAGVPGVDPIEGHGISFSICVLASRNTRISRLFTADARRASGSEPTRADPLSRPLRVPQ